MKIKQFFLLVQAIDVIVLYLIFINNQKYFCKNFFKKDFSEYENLLPVLGEVHDDVQREEHAC